MVQSQGRMQQAEQVVEFYKQQVKKIDENIKDMHKKSDED